MKLLQHPIIVLSSLVYNLVSAAAIPDPQITQAPSKLVKRAQQVLSDSVWTTTSSRIIMAVTPTVIDGVTISASPITGATPWASLDSSGIPYLITPTVSDGKTISASPTPTDASYPSASFVPPVLRCFGDRIPSSDTDGYPFCSAANGTEMVVGETYWLTWDPTYWGGSDVTKVKIELTAYPQTASGSNLLTTPYLNNADGYYPLTIDSSFVRDGNGYFFVIITPLTTSNTDAKNTGAKRGPLIRAITSVSDASSEINRVPSDATSSSASTTDSKSSSKSKTIAPAVVVPVIVVIAIAAAVVWYLQKQKKAHAAKTDGTNEGAGNEIQLSPTSTRHNDVSSTTTTETDDPFRETSRTVL